MTSASEDQDRQNETATGAPGTLTLGGRVWVVEQPTPQHFGMLRQWVRKRLKKPLQEVAEAVRDLPPEVQEAAIREAVRSQAAGSDLTGDRIQDELSTVEGCSFWLWILARKHHFDATPGTFAKLMDEDSVFGVLADLHEATRMQDVDPNGHGANGSSPSPTSSK